MLPLLAQTAADYSPPLPGYIPFARGSLMLDTVFLAMFLIVPAMLASILIARYGRKFALHGLMQVGMAIVLLLAVAAFEIDMQLFTDWEKLAAKSRFYNAEEWNLVYLSLTAHLLFAIPTPFIWIFVIVQALRHFGLSPRPGKHSESHRFWGRVAAFEMTMTAVTGWIFYVIAFVM